MLNNIFCRIRNLARNDFSLFIEDLNSETTPGLEIAQKEEINKKDSILNSAIESSDSFFENFRQCPYCLNYVENPSGSKFIICYSFLCKGNRYFCWKCNHKLYINDKEKHFDLYGMYSDFCINKRPSN